MRIALSALIVLAGLGGASVSMSAQSAAAAPPPPASGDSAITAPSWFAPARSNAFGNLFGQEKPSPSKPVRSGAAPSIPADAAGRTVVCGMTLVPADPNLDNAMRRPAPQADFRLRTLVPRDCRR